MDNYNKLLIQNYNKELKDRHNNFTGNYKMDDIDFNLYLKYISLKEVHTYQGFKDFKLNNS